MLRRLVCTQTRTQKDRGSNLGRQESCLPLSYDLRYAFTCIYIHMYLHAQDGREEGSGQKSFLSFLIRKPFVG